MIDDWGASGRAPPALHPVARQVQNPWERGGEPGCRTEGEDTPRLQAIPCVYRVWLVIFQQATEGPEETCSDRTASAYDS